MESLLRKLRNDMKKTIELNDKEGLGGKGRLTDQQIQFLQFYYRKAIRDNTNSLEKMKEAV